MPSWKDLVDAARRDVPEISVADLEARRRRGEHFVLLDVREDDERRNGYIPGAIHVSRGMLEFKVPQVVPDRNTPIVAYDAGGTRSLLAGRVLKELGYPNVVSLAGGAGAWRAAGGRVAKERVWTAQQLERYSRHFMLKEVGKEGQARLLDSKALLVGAGGLGSPIALYLAAAGVGTLGVVDSDVVDISNLQRQILHTTDRVGVSKVESAAKTVTALNPDVRIEPHAYRLTPDNVMDVMKNYDVVVDGADNFDTRYMLNDAAFFLKKPIVHGSIFQFEGQVTTIAPHLGGPCYRCMYPERPPAEFAPG
jgi:molybdopterin/thiamine biosynthesis adenylyltransferase/rhodanese-related sulfurtransferase